MARAPLAVAASDTHLDWQAWERREGLVGDAFWSFRQLIDYCVAKQLPLLLAGDTLNKKTPDSRTAEFLRLQMDRMAKHRLQTLYTQGQHEAASPPWFQAVHNWPTWVHDQPFSLAMLEGYGLDFQLTARVPEALAKIPRQTDVLLLHQVVTDFMGGVRVCELSLSQVPHAKIVFIGDYHEHRQLEVVGQTGQAMRVYSPGSTCMRKIDEPAKKAFYVLWDDLSVSSHALRTRELREPPLLATPEDLNAFVEQVGEQLDRAWQAAVDQQYPEELQKPLLWVHYRAELAQAWPRIQRAVGDRAFLFRRCVRAVDETNKPVQRLGQTREGTSLLEALAQQVPDATSPCYQISRRLLEATPGAWDAELQKLRIEFGLM